MWKAEETEFLRTLGSKHPSGEQEAISSNRVYSTHLPKLEYSCVMTKLCQMQYLAISTLFPKQEREEYNLVAYRAPFSHTGGSGHPWGPGLTPSAATADLTLYPRPM